MQHHYGLEERPQAALPGDMRPQADLGGGITGVSTATPHREIGWNLWDLFLALPFIYMVGYLHIIFPSIFCQNPFHFSFSHSCGSTGNSPWRRPFTPRKKGNLVACAPIPYPLGESELRPAREQIMIDLIIWRKA